MDINDIFSKYANREAELVLYQRAMKKIADKELTELFEYSEAHKEHQDILDLPRSINNMYFYAAKDAGARLYGHKTNSIEDEKMSVILHKNKQYQWLLAEAYEAYEDFIEQSYAYLAFINHNTWPLSDYGNINLSELSTKEYEYFLAQAKNKKDKPNSMIKQFRKVFPQYEVLETTNKLSKDLRFMINIAEKFRHHIVHTSGKVQDKKKCIEDIIKMTGIYNNGKYDIERYNFIDGFFGSEEYSNTIVLLEIPDDTKAPILFEINRLNILTSSLITDAHILFEEILNMEKELGITTAST
jgi:hypothetical protein